jgi:ferredoxin
MRIEVKRELCCGAGMCVLEAPEVFDQDEQDGLVLVQVSEPPEDQRAAVREAAHMCPSGAIAVSD